MRMCDVENSLVLSLALSTVFWMGAGVNILVGSPGRMLDHLKATESFNLNNLRCVY